MQAARGASLNSSEPEAPPRTGTPGQPRLWSTFVLVATALYAIDVTSKIIAVERLSDRGTVEILGSWFGLHLTRNPGAAFSTGTSYTVLFSVLSIVAAGLVIYFSRRIGSLWWAVGLGALLAGILGNLTDRVLREPGPFRGHVIDFLQLPHWPIFNVADICINVAAGVIILQAIRGIGLDGTRHERTSR